MPAIGAVPSCAAARFCASDSALFISKDDFALTDHLIVQP